MSAPQRLPADLTDTTKLPDVVGYASEGFGFEWYEMTVDGTRSVVLYRFTRGGQFSWSTCIPVSAGESFASIIRRAKSAL